MRTSAHVGAHRHVSAGGWHPSLLIWLIAVLLGVAAALFLAPRIAGAPLADAGWWPLAHPGAVVSLVAGPASPGPLSIAGVRIYPVA